MPESPADFRILGVDPGLNFTGYGVVVWTPRGIKMLEAGVVRSKPTQDLSVRLAEIHQGITEVIRLYQPQTVALEQLYSHYERPRTAILMGHARGCICLAAAEAQLTVHDYAATQVKKTLTGNGRAPKLQVQVSIQRELQLASLPEPSDVADALAVALCHAYSLNRPQLAIRDTRPA